MKNIYIYLPHQAVGMSAMLIKDLCWVATKHALSHQEITAEAGAGDHVHLVSSDGKPVRCFSGNDISVDKSLDQVSDADAMLVSAYWGENQHTIDTNQPLIERLQQIHREGIPIAGFSNGPFLLAEAGLLDNKVATVYPPVAESFQQRYPTVNLRAQRAITDAGNLYCANGIASGCDLIVSIIEMLYGPEVARQMSHDYLLGFNRSYSVANVGFDGQKYHRDRQILTAQQWLERHYASDVSMEAVAADVGMSSRNFSRRFKVATGDSPGQYLRRIRLEVAKDLLENSDNSISEIAYRVGYSDAGYFSKVFVQQEACQPNIYRENRIHS